MERRRPAFVQTCKEWKIPFHIERSRSGEGAHVWFFFEKAIKATLARKFGLSLLEKTNEKRLEIGLDSFDRLFPNQDFLPRGGMGNLIALPFQNEARLKGNSVFVNEAFEEYEDQWAYLSSIKKLRDKEIQSFLNMVLTEVPLVLKEGSISDIPLPDAIEIELKNGFHIPKSKLPSKVLYELKKLATFGNPEFYKAQAKRFSTHRIPKMIDCSELRDGSLVLPRCCVNCKAPSEFVNYCPQNPTN